MGFEAEAGTLYVVATPIGNLDDLSPHALAALRTVKSLFCEDTRHTKPLLARFGIERAVQSLHEHNETQRAQKVCELLAAGQSVGLLSDAGTPAVSDPGAVVVARALADGHRVRAVAGPSAMAAALSVAGFEVSATQPLLFLGFLPAKGRERRDALEQVAAHRGVVLLFEAPHRLLETLGDLAGLDATREIAACRELTKLFEEVRRSTAQECLAHFQSVAPQGEFVLALGPLAAAKQQPDAAAIDAALRRCLSAGLSTKDAAQAVSLALDVSKRQAYERALELGH